jgi:lipopolysaccharide biosynthesis glycosyltransferase
MTLSDEIEEELKIYVGWDSREDIAYQVCKKSIRETATVPVNVVPLKQKALRTAGLYNRPIDALASTEFTFTRFLVPRMMGYKGWALFIDCDFVFLDDVKNLFDQRNDKYALMCAQHDYTPKEGIKMDGKQQLNYPRKNWSSMMLINCGHPSNLKLTPELVNDEYKTGAYFHRFSWLQDHEIGKLSHEWNWLVGWYEEPKDGVPSALHYTEGGPWFPEHYNCEYNKEWLDIERKILQDKIQKNEKDNIEREIRPVTTSQLSVSDSKKKLIDDLIKINIDPHQKYYKTEIADMVMMNKFQDTKTHRVAAIFNDDLNYETRDYVYDEYLEAFAIGSDGKLSDWESEQNSDMPLVIRGVGKKARLAFQHCWDTGRTYYCIDTGYWGNDKSKSKGWHRITKNNLQNLGPIINRPGDRLRRIGYKFRKFTEGRKILICPPSEKVMFLWDQPTPEEWVRMVTKELKKYTDRPIEIRMKPKRINRVTDQTMAQALADDVHCMITYNSIAATEALMLGKPAIALGPNAASVLCNDKLSEVENLNIPTKDEMDAFMRHLSYCQFTKKEMMDGTAFGILNEGS